MTSVNPRFKGMGKIRKGLRALEKHMSPNGGAASSMAKAVALVFGFTVRATHVISGRLRGETRFAIFGRNNQLVGMVEQPTEYAVYEYAHEGMKSNSLMGSTPHNTLVFTLASTKNEVEPIFADDLNTVVSFGFAKD